jgi:hypothetical protein
MDSMKKLTAYRVDVLGIDCMGYAKLEGIIHKEYGKTINSFWAAILSSISFTYDGNFTRDELILELSRKMQKNSIPGRITELVETSLGKLADPKYAPRIKITKLDEKNSKEKDNQ